MRTLRIKGNVNASGGGEFPKRTCYADPEELARSGIRLKFDHCRRERTRLVVLSTRSIQRRLL
jgi:hypothetical protein